MLRPITITVALLCSALAAKTPPDRPLDHTLTVELPVTLTKGSVTATEVAYEPVTTVHVVSTTALMYSHALAETTTTHETATPLARRARGHHKSGKPHRNDRHTITRTFDRIQYKPDGHRIKMGNTTLSYNYSDVLYVKESACYKTDSRFGTDEYLHVQGNYTMDLEPCLKFCQGSSYFAIANGKDCFCSRKDGVVKWTDGQKGNQCDIMCGSHDDAHVEVHGAKYHHRQRYTCGGKGFMNIYSMESPSSLGFRLTTPNVLIWLAFIVAVFCYLDCPADLCLHKFWNMEYPFLRTIAVWILTNLFVLFLPVLTAGRWYAMFLTSTAYYLWNQQLQWYFATKPAPAVA